MTILFVGIARSHAAKAMGVRWEDGQLAAKPLFAALHANRIRPKDCMYFNLWSDPDEVMALWSADQAIVKKLWHSAKAGHRVVALGRLVERTLREAHVEPFYYLPHPAARGSIRLRANYVEAVRELLGQWAR